VRSTGQIISQTVESLLATAVSEDRDALAEGLTLRKIYSQKLRDLADYLGVSYPYMPRKIKSGSWDAVDIDKLAIYFHCYPQDFVPGPNDDWGLPDMAPEANASTDVSGTSNNLKNVPLEPHEKTE
jgi:hypothetical protein